MDGGLLTVPLWTLFFSLFHWNFQLFVVSFSITNCAFISTQVYLSLSFIYGLYCRAKTQRNQGLLTMSGFTRLHRLDMEMHLMVRLPAYVYGVLFIMILRLGKRIPQRWVSAVTFSVTRRPETKFKSQVRTHLSLKERQRSLKLRQVLQGFQAVI